MICKVIEGKDEYKDVYATCLKTLINDVPNTFAVCIQPILIQAVQSNFIKYKYEYTKT